VSSDRGQHALREIHRHQPIASCGFQIPDIDEDAAASGRMRQCHREAAFDVVEVWRAEPTRLGEFIERAVARACRYQRDDGRAAGKRRLTGA